MNRIVACSSFCSAHFNIQSERYLRYPNDGKKWFLLPNASPIDSKQLLWLRQKMKNTMTSQNINSSSLRCANSTKMKKRGLLLYAVTFRINMASFPFVFHSFDKSTENVSFTPSIQLPFSFWCKLFMTLIKLRGTNRSRFNVDVRRFYLPCSEANPIKEILP